ncbi:src-like-adapter [Chanos chanos]|uniref:Src-like-adapter n=1 Tax=Chanos chanos TaxID=29144 RepID=A0A6J2W2F1_CHACN|nr:src-like-adapter [Chanos chanos]
MGNSVPSEKPTDLRHTTASSDLLSGESDRDTVVVVSDYPPAEVCEPIFRAGEWLSLVSDEGYWWKVYSPVTKEENYIPHCHVSKVYHGWLYEKIGRPKAEALLRLPGNRVGSFMIRKNNRGEGEASLYTLSVRHRSIMHYRIFRLPNNWYFISPRLTFQCLEDLVNHYSDIADGLCCVLTGPCLLNTEQNTTPATQAPPVMRRRNFDWSALNSSELIVQSSSRCSGNRDSMISYGVQNSVSSYLSLVGVQEKKEKRKYSWKRTRRSVCGPPRHQLSTIAMEEDVYEEVP